MRGGSGTPQTRGLCPKTAQINPKMRVRGCPTHPPPGGCPGGPPSSLCPPSPTVPGRSPCLLPTYVFGVKWTEIASFHPVLGAWSPGRCRGARAGPGCTSAATSALVLGRKPRKRIKTPVKTTKIRAKPPTTPIPPPRGSSTPPKSPFLAKTRLGGWGGGAPPSSHPFPGCGKRREQAPGAVFAHFPGILPRSGVV